MAREKMTDEERKARNREYAARAYAKNPEKIRERSARWRAANLDKCRDGQREYDAKRAGDPMVLARKRKNEKTRLSVIQNKRRALVSQARGRARKSGMECTITEDTIDWPTHCKVLGIELNYAGGKGSNQPDSPSLDRWNNDIGYTPHNTVVISWRANNLKSNGTLDELFRVAYYAKYGKVMPPPGLEDVWGD